MLDNKDIENLKENFVTKKDLALMIGKGFNGVDEKFKGVDKKFESVDENFKNAEENASVRFNKIENRLKVIDSKVSDIVYRNEFEKLESKVKEIEIILAGAGIKL